MLHYNTFRINRYAHCKLVSGAVASEVLLTHVPSGRGGGGGGDDGRVMVGW